MTTIIQYTPNARANFQFSADFDGNSYSVVMTWNEMGQRYYVSVYDESNNVVLSLPLIGSTDKQNLSMTAGYFTTQLVFRPDLQQFQVI